MGIQKAGVLSQGVPIEWAVRERWGEVKSRRMDLVVIGSFCNSFPVEERHARWQSDVDVDVDENCHSEDCRNK